MRNGAAARFRHICVIAIVAVLAIPPLLEARVVKANLKPVPIKVGRLFAPSPKIVQVVVRDERAPDPLIAWGKLGSRTLTGFYAERPEEVPGLIESGARDALAVLGLQAGSDISLEITLKELRIFAVSVKYSILPHETGYVVATAAVRSGKAEITPPTPLLLALYDVGAINRIYSRAGWAAAASILPGALALKPDPAAVAALLAQMNTTKDDDVLEQGAFWSGYAGG